MKTVRPLRGDLLAGDMAILANRRLSIGQKDKVSLRALRLCGELLPPVHSVCTPHLERQKN